MQPARPLLVLLVAAVAVADLTVVSAARGQTFPQPSYVAVLALMFGQVGLLGLGAGLGPGSLAARLTLLGAGITAWAWALEFALGAAPWQAVARLCGAQAGLIAILSYLGRTVVNRRGPAATGGTGPAVGFPRHYGLAHLLLAMTAVALAVALASSVLVPLPAGRIGPLWLVVNNTTVALGAAWIVGSPGRRLTGLLVLLALACALGLVVGPTFADSGIEPGPLLAMIGLEAALILACLTAFRAATQPIAQD